MPVKESASGVHFRQNCLVRIMTGETALQENKEQEYSCR
jgi:hypothetical protein